MPVSVGFDLVSIDHIRDAIAEHGDRYLDRVYTAQERADTHLSVRQLAACFAAKEAVLKALGEGQQGFAWTAVEVLWGADGQPAVALHGRPEQLARDRGVHSIVLSVSYQRAHAAAVALITVR
jgi:holo-[acyl-carrier protein] synthase